MIDGKKIGVVIPAAGKGRRMGGSQDKQFIEIDGKPIIVRTIEQFQSVSEIDLIILAADPIYFDFLHHLIGEFNLSKVAEIVPGGEKRQDSVWNGLKGMLQHKIDAVIIHDAVRPFIRPKLIRQLLEMVLQHRAAIVAVPPKDTVKYSIENGYHETISRDKLWLAQTPQAFAFSLIYSAFEKAFADKFYGTDDASLVERMGEQIRIIEGSYENIKITTPEDIELAKLILKRQLSGNK